MGGNRVGGQSGEASPFSSVGFNAGEKNEGIFFRGESESGERLFSAKAAEKKKEGVAGGRIDAPEFATSFCKKSQTNFHSLCSQKKYIVFPDLKLR